MPTKNSVVPATAPSRQQVFEEVCEIVSHHTDVPLAEIQEHHTLETDLGYDSLEVVETAMEIEEEFDVHVPDELEEQFSTVGDIVDGVMKLLGQAR